MRSLWHYHQLTVFFFISNILMAQFRHLKGHLFSGYILVIWEKFILNKIFWTGLEPKQVIMMICCAVEPWKCSFIPTAIKANICADVTQCGPSCFEHKYKKSVFMMANSLPHIGSSTPACIFSDVKRWRTLCCWPVPPAAGTFHSTLSALTFMLSSVNETGLNGAIITWW